MTKYREIWLPETETQLEVLMTGMCLEQALYKDGLAESEKVFQDIAFLCALLEAGKDE